MDKQMIVAIGREFGSGGHIIGEEIAKRFSLPFYDHNLLSQIAEDNNMDHEILKQYDEKMERVKEVYQLSAEEAKEAMKREDWKRKSYHNYYCKSKWGDSRNYDLTINSSKLGIEKTIDILEQYIKERIEE